MTAILPRRLALALLPLLLAGSLPAAAADLRYYRFSDKVRSGQEYRVSVRPDLVFALLPRPGGWEIAIFGPDPDAPNLARLTPELAGGNPRYIEGWQFRTPDNSGPASPDPGVSDAPGRVRLFRFAPEVATLSPSAPFTDAFLARITERGRGSLIIDNLALGNLGPQQVPYIAAMAFTVELVVAWAPPETAP